MLIFVVWIVGLFGTFLLSVGGLTYIVVAVADRRPCPLRIPAGMLCGYAAGALFIWTLVPGNWKLSFWTTLAATVNTDKYGHALEHAAEGIVIWMMFAGVAGAVVGGWLAHVAGSRLGRRTFAPAR